MSVAPLSIVIDVSVLLVTFGEVVNVGVLGIVFKLKLLLPVQFGLAPDPTYTLASIATVKLFSPVVELCVKVVSPEAI
jgi:hypothetical protein